MVNLNSLNDNEINRMVAQELGYYFYEWEEECSQLTPGRDWSFGTDSYVIKCSTYVKPNVWNRTEEEWETGYSKLDEEKSDLDWYSDLDHYLDRIGYQLPNFCNDFNAIEQIIDYIRQQSTQEFVTITMSDKGYEVIIGDNNTVYICSGKELPRTLCKCFLKYKGFKDG